MRHHPAQKAMSARHVQYRWVPLANQARGMQVEAELQAVSASFARMHGRGELTLDLYGRGTLPAASADVKADASRKMSNMQRRSRLR